MYFIGWVKLYETIEKFGRFAFAEKVHRHGDVTRRNTRTLAAFGTARACRRPVSRNSSAPVRQIPAQRTGIATIARWTIT
jgi:hypothetical protein